MPNEEGQAPESEVAQESPTPTETSPEPEFAESPVTQNASAPKSQPKRRVRAWVWWVLSIVVVAAVLATLAWRFSWYETVSNRFNAASVTLKVLEDDKFAVEGAAITFNSGTYTTDASGQVSIVNTVKGSYSVSISKEGYVTVEQNVLLIKGDNGTKSFTFKKEAAKTGSAKGLVSDYVTGLALADAQVSVAGKTVRTDAAGGYLVEGIAPGEYTVAVSKTGFTSKEQKVAVALTTGETTKVSLVPQGSVLFVSNRDGKRALYTAAYDGSGQKQFITPTKGTEDFGPITSPDGAYIVFSSTRDKVASSYGSDYVPRLYIVDKEGKTVKKISSDVSPSVVTWSSDSRFVYFEAYTDAKLTTYSRGFYDTTKGNVISLGEDAQSVAFSSDGKSAAYVVSTTTGGVVTYSLKLITLTNGARKTLTDTIQDYYAGEGTLAFSSDDTEIYYQTQPSDGRKQYKLTLAGGQIIETAIIPAKTYTVVASPDGKSRAFLDTRDGKKDLFVFPADSQVEKRLTTLGVLSTAAPISWDVTSSYLTFAVVRDGESALYIVSAKGGEVRKIVDFTQDPTTIPYY